MTLSCRSPGWAASASKSALTSWLELGRRTSREAPGVAAVNRAGHRSGGPAVSTPAPALRSASKRGPLFRPVRVPAGTTSPPLPSGRASAARAVNSRAQVPDSPGSSVAQGLAPPGPREDGPRARRHRRPGGAPRPAGRPPASHPGTELPGPWRSAARRPRRRSRAALRGSSFPGRRRRRRATSGRSISSREHARRPRPQSPPGTLRSALGGGRYDRGSRRGLGCDCPEGNDPAPGVRGRAGACLWFWP